MPMPTPVTRKPATAKPKAKQKPAPKFACLGDAIRNIVCRKELNRLRDKAGRSVSDAMKDLEARNQKNGVRARQRQITLLLPPAA